MSTRVRSRVAVLVIAVAVAVAVAVGVSGCGTVYIGPEDADPATGPMRCAQSDKRPSGMQVLLAQAVPTASAVPCLRSDAGDWTVTSFHAEDGRARVEFSYRYGNDDTATVDLAVDCDVRAAQEVSSQFDGVREYNRTATRDGRYANEIHYVYPGACTSLRFDLSGRGANLRGAEIAGALGFVSREDLDQQIRTASDEHLHLDPP
jgi:hypothetical protein